MEAGGHGVFFFFFFCIKFHARCQNNPKKGRLPFPDSAFTRPALCLLRQDLISHCLESSEHITQDGSHPSIPEAASENQHPPVLIILSWFQKIVYDLTTVQTRPKWKTKSLGASNKEIMTTWCQTFFFRLKAHKNIQNKQHRRTPRAVAQKKATLQSLWRQTGWDQLLPGPNGSE